MQSILLQLFNLALIIMMLGAPVVITILLLKHFGNNKGREENLLEKIRDLESRIKKLEDKD
jgi:hypothetical protein